jgi:hypothetical protein
MIKGHEESWLELLVDLLLSVSINFYYEVSTKIVITKLIFDNTSYKLNTNYINILKYVQIQ